MIKIGKKVAFYWFGLDVKIQQGYFCLHVSPYRSIKRWFMPWRWYCYASLDATPYDESTVWFFGREWGGV